MVCPHCGNEVNAIFELCPKCGKGLRRDWSTEIRIASPKPGYPAKPPTPTSSQSKALPVVIGILAIALVGIFALTGMGHSTSDNKPVDTSSAKFNNYCDLVSYDLDATTSILSGLGKTQTVGDAITVLKKYGDDLAGVALAQTDATQREIISSTSDDLLALRVELIDEQDVSATVADLQVNFQEIQGICK